MEERSRGNYVIAGRETVAEGADLRVVALTLAEGQCVPWHYHSAITDSFVCLEGPSAARMTAPANSCSCRASASMTSCRSAADASIVQCILDYR